MAANSIGNNQKGPRDAIVNAPSSSSGSPKRSDTLNGSPRTKSLGGQGANYSKATKSDAWNSAPPPNNPYGKG